MISKILANPICKHIAKATQAYDGLKKPDRNLGFGE